MLFLMMNKKYKTLEEMIDKLQILGGKTKFKFLKDFITSYDDLKYLRQSGFFHFEGDTLSENAPNRAMNMHEALMLVKFFQRKSQKGLQKHILL